MPRRTRTSCNTARPARARAGTPAPSCSTAVLGAKITHVPYRGAGPAMQDLLGGRLDYMLEQISTATPQIKAGAVKAYAALGVDRGPGLENIPTAAELGYKRPRLRRLGRAVAAEGHAEADHRPARHRLEPRHRYARGDRAVQVHRCRGHREGPPLAGILDAVRKIRDRTLGRADQGQRRVAGLAQNSALLNGRRGRDRHERRRLQ